MHVRIDLSLATAEKWQLTILFRSGFKFSQLEMSKMLGTYIFPGC